MMAQDYIAKHNACIAKANHVHSVPFVMQDGQGSVLNDVEGKKYIDFLSSAACLPLGVNHPIVAQAVQEQLHCYSQYIGAYVYNPATIAYAEALCQLYPAGEQAQICFGVSGSDANDGAIKFARAYTRRPNIIVFDQGYHGNTLAGMSMTSTLLQPDCEVLRPLLSGIYRLPFCDNDSHAQDILGKIEHFFATDIAPETVACIIIEPLQGDSGQRPASAVFLQGLWELCKRHGILFFAEEIQQGFGRTGKWFSIDHYAIVPDGILLGKALGAGFPLSAFMAKKPIMESLGPLDHAFTFGGNALASAAGLAQLSLLQEEGFLEEVTEKGQYIQSFFAQLQSPLVGNVHGLGLSIGVEIVHPKTKQPDVKMTRHIVEQCFAQGLLMTSLAGNILRIQPALNIPHDVLAKGLAIIERVLKDAQPALDLKR